MCKGDKDGCDDIKVSQQNNTSVTSLLYLMLYLGKEKDE